MKPSKRMQSRHYHEQVLARHGIRWVLLRPIETRGPMKTRNERVQGRKLCRCVDARRSSATPVAIIAFSTVANDVCIDNCKRREKAVTRQRHWQPRQNQKLRSLLVRMTRELYNLLQCAWDDGLRQK